MTTLTVAGTTLSNLDGVSSVVTATQTFNSDPTPANNVALQAAIANAGAAMTANVPGLGAAFSANAVSANLTNLQTNGSSMSNTDIAGTLTSMAGEVVTMLGQGVQMFGLEESNITL